MRKGHAAVYLKKGFYPIDKNNKCLFLNFNTLVTDHASVLKCNFTVKNWLKAIAIIFEMILKYNTCTAVALIKES